MSDAASTAARSPLLIVQTGFLGDAVLASGMLRALRADGGRWSAGILVREDVATIFEGHPGLSRVHRIDKKRKGEMARVADELRSVGYRIALVPHRSFRSAWLVRRAGIDRRIGFRQSDAPFLFSDRVEYDIGLHETERNARLLHAAGIDTTHGDIGSWLTPRVELVDAMRLRFAGERPVVVVAPGSAWRTKQWSADGYRALVERLARTKRPVLVGSSGEGELCREIARGAGIPSSDVTAGELSLPGVLALLSIAERVYTNDSAPLHLAESVGTPVTAVFGPTVPEFGFGPRLSHSRSVEVPGLACRPCRIHGGNRCPIGTHECMTKITAEDLLAPES